MELQKKKITGFRGLRTTALVTVFGTISTFFKSDILIPTIFFLVIASFVFLAYWNGFKKNRIGLTSEISLMLMFWTGVLIGQQNFISGIIIGIFVALSDAYKDKMHSFAKTLKLKEWSGTLQMILITLVVLPFLPKKAIDPWGVFIPYDVWVLVILVTGIGFFGYFLDKYFNKKKINGLYLTSFLGSILSSTAVTVQVSQKTKKTKLDGFFVSAIGLSIGVMLVRDIAIILIASGTFNFELIRIPLIMVIFSTLYFIYYFYKNIKIDNDNHSLELEESSPFEIIPSLKFAFVFVLILFIIHFVKEWAGDHAVYLTSIFIALVDTETIILPAIESFKNNSLTIDVLKNVIWIAIVINTLIKLFYIWIFAERRYFWKALLPISIISFSGLVFSFIF